ncbi:MULTISPECIES: DUF302 domain-containing protein [Dietzia]|jgi:uncharacterized protein (DUF302 family)|uniref:DUF302 domain-containing protein n=3 Tax=Dietzia TaxID=37914 RepID=A0A365P795_9ACTN|nr:MULTISPECIES: DUF302 domain-containing protein [Dietzia]EFV91399.1 hypothetical protein ES5_11171 [Dietzia cinnamea P4]MBB0990512.1 DUF302 domain-containing protein [Dietzia sp. SLG510A3-30A2]MBB0994363.1 DUF302 domain-containing protein [Dietzia sp. SLG510A3-40A3]MBB1008313.1 DUF302 domain-containing protein [Dietzia sp. SLG510A3-3B2-2]ODQ96912.1 ABC transporter [Dietzia alimentaria]HBD22483.1 DUF302 domain-containing protein [Dietzia sp.]
MDIGIGTFTEMEFDEAVEATRAALADRGFGILHEIDLTATLKNKIDKDIERVLILGACNPGFAGKAFDVSKDVALMIPCNVVIRESGGGCVIEAQNPDLLSQVISGGLQDLADELTTDMRSMMKDLTR